jgi:hypothetical protein
LIDSQSQIGWKQLLLGRFSVKWLEYQAHHLRINKIPFTNFNHGPLWLSTLINRYGELRYWVAYLILCNNNIKSILRLYPTRPSAQERHHLPSSRGTRLLLYYVLNWGSVEKPKEKKIGENSLVSSSVTVFR